VSGIEISTDAARLDVAMIHGYLSNESYWARGISRANVEKSIRHSLCFGLYTGERQAAFARVTSDFVRFAHLLDVFVVPPLRSRGYGKLLIAHILSYPGLSSVSRFTLGTEDAHGLYAKFGFSAPANPHRLMELTRQSAVSDAGRSVVR
jgi:GNAT superfamily N-acetyltransferase